ncbi:hypothetical protein MMC19_002377 [Ptychographa xylographoides]|nr:hypothetical protein [Ptychographa xylographoides]
MFGFARTKNIRFSPVSQEEGQKVLISDSDSFEDVDSPSKTRTRPSHLCLALVFAIALPTAALLGAWVGSHRFASLDSLCTQHVSQSSPVVKDVDIEYNVITFNGSLMNENIFRQDAAPEVDAAWQSLGVDYRSAIVPSKLAELSGLAPSQVQVNEKYGGGFPANVEGLHHLHCLNLLRQSLYYNFDYYYERKEGAFINADDILRLHVSHCLDILRQQLMCTVDVGVLGQIWWDKQSPKAYVDFNTRHKCRNFDAVRQWAKEHQAPKEVPDDYLKPPRSLDDVYATMP